MKVMGEAMINGIIFGSRVKLARQERGYTIEKAAELCDVSESIWRQYERGARFPTINHFIELCKVMEQRPEYFLSNELFDLYKANDRLIEKLNKLPDEDLEILEAAADKMIERISMRANRI